MLPDRRTMGRDLFGHSKGPPRVIHVMCRVNKQYLFIALVLSAAVLYLSYSLSYCVVIDVGLNPTRNLGLSGRIRAALQRPCLSSPTSPPVKSWNSGTLKETTSYALKTLGESQYKYPILAQQGLISTRRLPSAIIIGVKKGGTRALLEFIRIHPHVRAVGAEMHFFDHHYGKGISWYRNQMPPSLESQLTIEKTPSYFVTKEAPKRIYQLNPNMLLIAVVRDPVTRAISDYTQAASKTKDIPSFEDMVFLNASSGMVDTSWGPIKIGIYSKHVERWLKYFPLKQMLFVSGEKLVNDPAYELGRVQDFLGLKRVITERHFYFNASKGFPCLLKSEVKPTPHCLGRTKGREHPYVNQSVLEQLRDFYRPFNNKFYRLTGMDFGWP